MLTMLWFNAIHNLLVFIENFSTKMTSMNCKKYKCVAKL